jgi:tetratricopeptide (TPR) repeat protein
MDHTPDSFVRAFQALEHAVKKAPECGHVRGMLGRLYGEIYSFEMPGFETALDKALVYANKGVQLNPENQRCRIILAQVMMLCNELNAARNEALRALELNPESLFILDGIGYLLTLLGDWEQGTSLIREVMQRNPFYSHYVHYALWVDWIHQENYERAQAETLYFKKPSFFWEALMQAVTLGQLGRYEEGKRAVDALLKLKPDFPERGRILIKHYIKFNKIVDRMVEGLEKVDLKLG